MTATPHGAGCLRRSITLRLPPAVAAAVIMAPPRRANTAATLPPADHATSVIVPAPGYPPSSITTRLSRANAPAVITAAPPRARTVAIYLQPVLATNATARVAGHRQITFTAAPGTRIIVRIWTATIATLAAATPSTGRSHHQIALPATSVTTVGNTHQVAGPNTTTALIVTSTGTHCATGSGTNEDNHTYRRIRHSSGHCQ